MSTNGTKSINRNSISLIRIVATFAILLCHYVSWFDRINFTGQIFNVGVPLFFIISGYLFGNKTIDKTFPWLKKRLLRIVTPVYLYYAVCVIVLLLIGNLGDISLWATVKQLLNLHGFVGGGIGNVVTGHLWFVSYIILCYILTPVLQFCVKHFSKRTVIGGVCIVAALEILLMLSIPTFEFMSWFAGCIAYAVAYFYCAYGGKKLNGKQYVLLSVLTVCMLGVRIFGKMYMDGSQLYDRVIVPYSHCVLAFWMFFTLLWIGDKLFDGKKDSKVLNVLNDLSYYVYIVHYCLLLGPLFLKTLSGNMAINSFCFFALTLVLAYVLKFLDNILHSKIIKNRN